MYRFEAFEMEGLEVQYSQMNVETFFILTNWIRIVKCTKLKRKVKAVNCGKNTHLFLTFWRPVYWVEQKCWLESKPQTDT